MTDDSETTHTEGPWVLGDSSEESLFLGEGAILKEIEPGGYAVLSEVNKYFDEWIANARLIAAAPTQHEAHQAIHRLLTYGKVDRAKRFVEKHDVDVPEDIFDYGVVSHVKCSQLARAISRYAITKATQPDA